MPLLSPTPAAVVVGDVLGLYNRNGITLNWALQNTQLSLTTPALKAKLNTKKAVPGVTATANSGVFNGSAAAPTAHTLAAAAHQQLVELEVCAAR